MPPPIWRPERCPLRQPGCYGVVAGDVTTLTAANGKVQGDFNQLATAQSVSQYTSVAGRLSLQSDLDTWQTAFDKLHNELNKP